MSRRPYLSTAVPTIFSQSASLVMFACTATASPPARLISSAVASAPAPLRSAQTTRAPSRANTLAVALPMPEAVPVIRATLPSTLPIDGRLERLRLAALGREVRLLDHLDDV